MQRVPSRIVGSTACPAPSSDSRSECCDPPPTQASASRNAATKACPSRSLSANPISTPIRRIRSGCCATAISGHAAAEPTTLMKSRRLIVAPEAWTGGWWRLSHAVRKGLRGSQGMSALCQKQTLRRLLRQKSVAFRDLQTQPYIAVSRQSAPALRDAVDS